MNNFKEKADLIWRVADLLRGDYKQSDYGKVILPLTVLRRLDCVLAKTKQKVLDYLPKIETLKESAKDIALNKIAGFNFHNRSQYNFDKMVADPNNVAVNLRNFINGFSTSAREIIEYFNFDDQIDRMDDPKADILFRVVKSFQEIDLADMTSMDMGYVFEDLIRRFAEQSNETAGEHFTPREVIRLMVNVLFIEDRDILTQDGIVKTMYDPACGTGGMLSVGEQYVKELNPKAELKVFGQEINPESYAICKSDMLIKGQNPANIKFGNTFTVDGLEEEKFDYMLSNPPFGVDWKKAEKIIKTEAEKKGMSGRFGAGTPRINDGSLLFLQHMISKMKPAMTQPLTPKGEPSPPAPKGEPGSSSPLGAGGLWAGGLGTRIGIVFNGSPLFTGAAESGESNIRQWIIENDWLEAVIALPDQLFYNTGISTYIWIVTNHKSKERRGKVQLINATGAKDEELMKEGKLDYNRFWRKMDRSLGNKRKAIAENGNTKGIGFITQLYGNFEENEHCKILPNEFFGYWRVTVEQPLRDKKGKVVKTKGQPKADTSLRDYENIPFLKKNPRFTGLRFTNPQRISKPDADTEPEFTPQTIEAYFTAEVLPHLPEAWIDETKTKIGFEINFTKYFYEFKPLRPLAEIKADILALEEKTLEMEKTVLEA